MPINRLNWFGSKFCHPNYYFKVHNKGLKANDYKDYVSLVDKQCQKDEFTIIF